MKKYALLFDNGFEFTQLIATRNSNPLTFCSTLEL